MTWQPIKTAPKDETVILLFGGGIVAPGFFHIGEWRFWDGGTTDDYEGDSAGFFNGWISGHGPSHWMPLPAPPEA